MIIIIDKKYFLRSEKKAGTIFWVCLCWKNSEVFNFNSCHFLGKSKVMFGLIFNLFSKLKCGQNRLKIRTLAYLYDRKISKLHFSCNFYFNLNSFKPFFKAFSYCSAFSQKMNLLKIIAHFWQILNKFFLSLIRTL